MSTFQSQISLFEHEVKNLDKLNTNVSEGSVGWHIAHCCLVMSSISNVIATSNPAEFVPKFNFKKTIVFFSNKIPRGKGKAPERVKPREVPTKESLLHQIEDAKQKVILLDGLNSDAFFEHPFFGKLNLKETKKFLSIHNLHHFKIIKDILK